MENTHNKNQESSLIQDEKKHDIAQNIHDTTHEDTDHENIASENIVHTESVQALAGDSQNPKSSSKNASNTEDSLSFQGILVKVEEEKQSLVASVESIIALAVGNNPHVDVELIKKAYDFASVAHAGQLRLSGAPYFMHPSAVAKNLAEMGFDEHTISAGLLHDAVEDTSASIEELDAEFGEQVADIVDGVTKISLMSFDTKEEAQAENIRKMILAMSHDIRVPIVKLADRRHNMRTLDFQKPHKQISISQETMDIYAPLANRLGLHRIKQDLEDLSFRYLQPERYIEITSWLEENQVVERQIVGKVINKIETVMLENEIQGRVFGRIKQVYSIFMKMKEQNTELDEMHDIIAFRVIVKELRDCYAVLGLVHALWRPVTGRFKDYISLPKANGYQSLHSTVIGPEGERIEIQIRTIEMDDFAEHGIASHWLYKEKDKSIKAGDMPQLQWIRDILERQGDESDSNEFMQSLRLDLFSDEIYVFTPNGAVKQLPEDATPIDFAYLIHSDVGSHCIGAKVNGKLVPLATKLKSGDTVQILTDKNRLPSRDWLKIVKTSKARTRIQHYLRTEERSAAISLGKDMLEKEGRRMGLNVSRAVKDGTVASLISEFSASSVEDLFACVGYAKFTPKKFLQRLQAILDPKEVETHKPEQVQKDTEKASPDGIVVQGLDDTLIHLAKCCRPIPGDQIVGFISRGRGIIVHMSDCPHLLDLEPERFISVTWQNQEIQPFPASIRVVSRNVQGILSKVALGVTNININIVSLILTTTIDDRAEFDFTVEVNDAVQLYQVMDILRKLDDVLEVSRSTAEY